MSAIKSLFLSLVLVSALTLSACLPSSSSTPAAESAQDTPAADQKQGDTTKTGTISQAGAQFFLNVAGSPPMVIDSYAVDLAQYVGQSVTVTGQYSGDTLFVGSVE